jgi:hypothetical protein
VTPVKGVSGRSISRSRIPSALCARWFFLARLPALVELIAPADAPLIRLRSLLCVVVLRFPDDALVELVLVVKVRLSMPRPTSYADLRWRSLRSGMMGPGPSMDDLGRSKG